MPDLFRLVADDEGIRRRLQAVRWWGGAPLPTVVLGWVRSAPAGVWTADDLGLVEALHDWESGLCGGCGHPLEETTAAENEDYIAESPIRCHRCTAISRAVECYEETPHRSALMFPVRRPRKRS